MKQFPTVMSSGGLSHFELWSNKLLEQNRVMPYSMTRSAVRKAFQKMGRFRFKYNFKTPNDNLVVETSGYHGEDLIQFGCQVFRQANYDKLKRWANQ